MKKMVAGIFLTILLMVSMCVCAETIVPSYGFTERIGEERYFINQFGDTVTLYSCDENWDNIEVIDNSVRGNDIWSDGTLLYYQKEEGLCQYDTVANEKKKIDFNHGQIQLIKDGCIYGVRFDDSNGVAKWEKGFLFKYNIKDETVTEITPAYSMLGIVDDNIYSYELLTDSYSIILSKISPEGEKTELKLDGFIAAVIYNDLIYVYDNETTIVVLDTDFKEVRHVKFDLGSSDISKNLYCFMELLADENYLYDQGVKINHHTGEISYFPENRNEIPMGDLSGWFYAEKMNMGCI